jgi:hypothetical protein
LDEYAGMRYLIRKLDSLGIKYQIAPKEIDICLGVDIFIQKSNGSVAAVDLTTRKKEWSNCLKFEEGIILEHENIDSFIESIKGGCK